MKEVTVSNEKAAARGHRKTRVGVVVSDAMDKTRVISVERLVRHTRYKKYIRRRKRLKAHDEANASHVGDKVLIVEARPLSHDKRWRIRTVLEKAR
jgi:small subunit ribosomal protein S17